MIYANTTSVYSTRFLAGKELIVEARDKFCIASETWTYPTVHQIGHPDDNYYAEIWVDGMDWQNNYWIIESINLDDPIVLPLLRFEDHSEQDKFNPYDYAQFVKAMLHYRRNEKWIKAEDGPIYNDTIWCFINKKFGIYKCGSIMLNEYSMEHASQPYVTFFANEEFIFNFPRRN